MHLTYILKRLLLSVPTLFISTLIIFFIVELTPGNPFNYYLESQGILENEPLPQHKLDKIKRLYNFDKPIHIRYLTWLGVYPRSIEFTSQLSEGQGLQLAEYKGIITGYFGESIYNGEPVGDLFSERLHVSLQFGIVGLIFGYLIAIILGLLKALKSNSKLDKLSDNLLLLGYSIPGWVLAFLLLIMFANQYLYIFPLGGLTSFDYDNMSWTHKIIDRIYHFILPTIAYTAGSIALLSFIIKDSARNTYSQKYIQSAKSRGFDNYFILKNYVIKNSLTPVISQLGKIIFYIISGSYIIEYAFNINGIGMLVFESIMARDYPVIYAFFAFSIFLQIMGNLISDIALSFTDRRIVFK